MSDTTTAESAADQARAKTQEVSAQARDRVRDQVDRRSTEAGEQAGSAAQALRDTSQKLRQEGNEPVAKGMEQVAQRVESAGGWLRDADGDRILRDVEDFGRRNPLAVAAGGLAIGFALSRLLKASSSDRYRGTSTSRSTTGYGNGRASLPQPTTTAPRAGIAVPDLPEPDRGPTGPGAVSPGTVPPAPPTTPGG